MKEMNKKIFWFVFSAVIVLSVVLLSIEISSDKQVQAQQPLKKFSPADAAVTIYKHTFDPKDPKGHRSDRVSGTLIKWGGKIHILTAYHVLPVTEINTPSGKFVLFTVGKKHKGPYLAKTVKLGRSVIIEGGKRIKIVDLALLETSLPLTTPHIKIGNKRPMIGETLRYIGLGAQKLSVDCFCLTQKTNFIAEVKTGYVDLLGTNLISRSGCSGGGFFNINNELVGVLIFGYGYGSAGEPIDTIREFLEMPPPIPAKIKNP